MNWIILKELFMKQHRQIILCKLLPCQVQYLASKFYFLGSHVSTCMKWKSPGNIVYLMRQSGVDQKLVRQVVPKVWAPAPWRARASFQGSHELLQINHNFISIHSSIPPTAANYYIKSWIGSPKPPCSLTQNFEKTMSLHRSVRVGNRIT